MGIVNPVKPPGVFPRAEPKGGRAEAERGPERGPWDPAQRSPERCIERVPSGGSEVAERGRSGVQAGSKRTSNTGWPMRRALNVRHRQKGTSRALGLPSACQTARAVPGCVNSRMLREPHSG